MNNKLKAIDRFFDEEVAKAEQKNPDTKIHLIVVARVLRRVQNELCDNNRDCFLYIMNLWMAIEESEDAIKQ